MAVAAAPGPALKDASTGKAEKCCSKEFTRDTMARHGGVCLGSQHSGAATRSRPAWATQGVPGQPGI